MWLLLLTQCKSAGGERKRACIAMELVTNPAIIFLDEPTSGLDTFTAFSVMHTLKELARTGRTVVAPIHQPSSEVVHMFDDLVIMASGRIMYHGDAEQSVAYFSRRGFTVRDVDVDDGAAGVVVATAAAGRLLAWHARTPKHSRQMFLTRTHSRTHAHVRAYSH